MSDYETMTDGDSVVIQWKDEALTLACCDCLLTHKLKFDVKGGKLLIIVERDNRATAQLRRNKRKGSKNRDG